MKGSRRDLRAVRVAGSLTVALVLGSSGASDQALLGAADAQPLRPLCAETIAAASSRATHSPDCALETWSFAPRARSSEGLTVMTWNLERGEHLDEQVAAFHRGVLPVPDVLLVSEADRGCSRSRGRNVVRDLAQALALNAVFGVEFVELPRPWGAGGRITRACEHGNAILSRFPLEHPRLLRFAAARSWYIGPGSRDRGGEPRLGGRMALSADVVLGERRLRAYSLHLESWPGDGDLRSRQSAELLTDVGSRGAVIVGGDTNFHLYGADLLLGSALEGGAFRLRSFGFRDAHEGLSVTARGTHLRWLVIDLLLGRGLRFDSPGLCPAARCGELSDHLPVWARATFEG